MEEKMKNNRIVYGGLFAILLIFIISVIGCTAGGLNGTWEYDDEDGVEITFDNRNVEISIDDMPFRRGTYTTRNKEITITWTHQHGGIFGMEDKWYTVEEFLSVFQFVDFTTSPSPFSISGNKLTLTTVTQGGTYVDTLTRK